MADTALRDIDNIGDLPNGQPDIQLGDLFLAEHSGSPVNVTGEQLTKFIDRHVYTFDANIVDPDAAGGAVVVDDNVTLNLPRGPGIKSITGPTTDPEDPLAYIYTVTYEDTRTTSGGVVPGGTDTFKVRNGRDGEGTVNSWCNVGPAVGSTDIPLASVTAVIRDLIFPVGSVYMTVSNTDLSNWLGGTWVQIEESFLLAASAVDSISPTYEGGDTGGSANQSVDFSNGYAEIGWNNEHADGLYNRVDISSSFTATHRMIATGSVIQYARGGDNAEPLPGIFPVMLGGEQAIDLPPYTAVYVWKRTA